MFKDVKLIDVCNRDITAMFHGLKQWFYNFDICNSNSDFISINETNRQRCLFFKTCNNQKDVRLVFTEILLRTYLNVTKNIYEIFTKKYKHFCWLDFINDECFRHAYCLMRKFSCHTNSDFYLHICLHFVPNKNYDSNCFKIINWHYLKYIEDKEKQKLKNKRT